MSNRQAVDKRMTLNVHLLESNGGDDLPHLQAHLADGIQLSIGETPPAGEHLAACPDLRAVIVPWAGVSEATRELLADFPHVTLHNLHYNAAATAEMAIALLMAAAKFIVPLDRKLRAGDWTPRYGPSQSIGLAGKTALVLGYGEIGRRVARACAALDMSVLATRRTLAAQAAADAFAEVHSPADLKQFLPRAHALIITLPLTPETKGSIGVEEIASLPRGAILVNVGRGAIVDEPALYHALRDGHLLAAGLDVWYNYPADEASRTNTPPSNFPFHELDNVVMSPHRGGDAAGIVPLRMAHLAKLLNAAARGKPMPNRVDLKAGY